METQIPSTFIDKYLNIGVKESLSKLFEKTSYELSNKYMDSYISVLDEISNYQALYRKKLHNPELVTNDLAKLITEYINKNYQKINVFGADTNYFLNGVLEAYNEKFNLIVNKMNINHIIKMIDYTRENTGDYSTFKVLMNMYFKLFGDKILYGKFGKSNNHLYEQIDNEWSTINFDNLLNFVDVLSKLKYHKADTSKFDLVFQTKFDDLANINKLLDFINKNYISLKDTNSIPDINETQKEGYKNDNLKYNFRFIIDNLKSNGFLLFEQYYKNIQSRYESINIDMLNRDLKLIKHFMTIISQNEQTNVNRYVNEMLIKIRNYLFDLQESYYNNQTYQKIKIRAESDKYKNVNIDSYNRNLTNFKIFKYNYCTNPENILARAHSLDSGMTENQNQNQNQNLVVDYKNISPNLAGYLDIYRSYYKTRYPDREIEYDLIDSTIIVKMKFNDRPYYIHMALIQYMVLDKIMEKSDGITAQSISEQLSIPASRLNETFNSFLKIKIVKRTTGTNDISSVKFILNKDFSFEKNKLSISGIVKKEVSETKPVQREFLHERSMIILCNLIHYAKKNTYFTLDTIGEQLSYKIPFKVSDEQINKAIEKALADDYIKIQEIPNANGSIDIMYQYNDE